MNTKEEMLGSEEWAYKRISILDADEIGCCVCGCYTGVDVRLVKIIPGISLNDYPDSAFQVICRNDLSRIETRKNELMDLLDSWLPEDLDALCDSIEIINNSSTPINVAVGYMYSAAKKAKYEI